MKALELAISADKLVRPFMPRSVVSVISPVRKGVRAPVVAEQLHVATGLQRHVARDTSMAGRR